VPYIVILNGSLVHSLYVIDQNIFYINHFFFFFLVDEIAEDLSLHFYSSIDKSFKIKDCHSLYIANNFKTEPISDMLITEDGILVTVKLCSKFILN